MASDSATAEAAMPDWMRVLVDEMRAVRQAIERRERDEAERREREEQTSILRRLTEALDTMASSRSSPVIASDNASTFSDTGRASALSALSSFTRTTSNAKKRRNDYADDEESDIASKRRYTRKPSSSNNASRQHQTGYDARLDQDSAAERRERAEQDAMIRRLTEALDTVVPHGIASMQNKQFASSGADAPEPSSSQTKGRKKSGKQEVSGAAQSRALTSKPSSSGMAKEKSDASSSNQAAANDTSTDAPKTRPRSAPRPRQYAESFEEARLCDFVLDPNGNWRTKRSILENPSGRRKGRPEGVKTGEGAGRSREVSRPLRKADVMQMLSAANNAKMQQQQQAQRPTATKRKATTALREQGASSHEHADFGALDDDVIASALHTILSSSSPPRMPPQRKAPTSPARPSAMDPPSSPSLPSQRKAPSSPARRGAKKVQGSTDKPMSTMAQRYANTAKAQKARESVAASKTQKGMAQSTPNGVPIRAHRTPLSTGRQRYGAPAHLLTSSPATAFQTVMDEADTDWKALFGFHHSPVRRSPRKKPAGVHDHLNPYASDGVAVASHEDEQSAGVNSNALMHMTSSSPLTRGRVKSGQFGWAWGTPSDNIDGQTKATSAITSPTSPSPNRTRRLGKRMAASDTVLEAGPLGSSMSGAGTARGGNLGRGKQQDVENGPFMGSSSLDDAHAEDNQHDKLGEQAEYEVPGSPTLGRSRRMDRKKQESRASAASSMLTTLGTPTSDSANSAALLQEAPSATNEWGRNAAIHDLFPAPVSPDKRWNAGSPSQALWNSPTSWALRMPTPSPVKASEATATKSNGKPTSSPADAAASHNALLNDTLSYRPSPRLAAVTRSHRKPLPATVEDATPSDINTSPVRGEEYDEEEDEEEVEAEVGANGEMLIDLPDGADLSALMSMFDDPYGLLAAMQQQQQQKQGADAGVAAPMPLQAQQNNGQMAPPSHIELFKSFDFVDQLHGFNEAGGNGIAANAGPSAPFTATTIGGKAGSVTGMTTHASPAFTVRISPRKAAARRTSMSPAKGGLQSTDGLDTQFGDWMWSEAAKSGAASSTGAATTTQ